MSYPRLILAVNIAPFKDGEKKERQDLALRVMQNNAPSNVSLVSFDYKDSRNRVPAAFKSFNVLERNSQKTIGNNRPLPYVKDIFNNCAKLTCDVFGYVNSDILLCKKFFENFQNKYNAYLFSRIDIKPLSYEDFMQRKAKACWKKHPGFDGIFFKKGWWLKNKMHFHDNLILGECEWDFYYRDVIKKRAKIFLNKRALYHIHHNTVWSLESKGAINNRKINGTII